MSGKGDEMIAKGLSVTHDVLSTNSHFSRVRWHDRKAFEQGKKDGVESPDR